MGTVILQAYNATTKQYESVRLDPATGAVLVKLDGGGGGGGGDASAANQALILTALDTIYDALALVGLEATSIEIRDAVIALGDGATLADLANAFATDAITQADILAALEASDVNLSAIKSGIDLLVPDLDAVRVAIESIDTKTPALSGGNVPVSGAFFPATQNVAPALQTAGSRFPVQITTDGANFAPVTAMNAPSTIPLNPPSSAAWGIGRAYAGTAPGLGYPLQSDTFGRMHTITRPDRSFATAWRQVLTAQPRKILGGRALLGTCANDMGALLTAGGTVTWSSANRSIDANVTGAAGDAARIATHRVTLANPNRSGGPTIHFKTGTVGTNNQYNAYITSSDNAYGFGIREQGGTISIVIRHPAVGGEVLIPSSAWNISTAAAIGVTSLNTTFHTVHGLGSGDGGFFTTIYLDGEPVHYLGPVPSAIPFPFFAWRIGIEAKNTAAGVAGTISVKSWAFDIYSGPGGDEEDFVPDVASRATDLTATTTEAPLLAIRPSATAGGVANDTSLFPIQFTGIYDTGILEFRAYYQRGGANPLGGTGTFVAALDTPHDVNTTATTWTPNANTEPVGFTGTATNGLPIDLTKIFGNGSKLAIRRRFNDADIEMLVITVKTRSSSHPANGILTFGTQTII